MSQVKSSNWQAWNELCSVQDVWPSSSGKTYIVCVQPSKISSSGNQCGRRQEVNTRQQLYTNKLCHQNARPLAWKNIDCHHATCTGKFKCCGEQGGNTSRSQRIEQFEQASFQKFKYFQVVLEWKNVEVSDWLAQCSIIEPSWTRPILTWLVLFGCFGNCWLGLT